MYTKMSECILGSTCFSWVQFTVSAALWSIKQHSCYSKFPNCDCMGFLFFFSRLDALNVKNQRRQWQDDPEGIKHQNKMSGILLSLPETEHSMKTSQLYQLAFTGKEKTKQYKEILGKARGVLGILVCLFAC